MKYLFLFTIAFASILKTKAQSTGEIVGVSLLNSEYSFKSMDLSTQTASVVSSLGWRAVWQGNSTYDRKNNMYYYRNGLYIYKVDAASGQVLDSLGQLNTFDGMEYNETCDCLMGIYSDPNFQRNFASIDFTSKNLNLINPVSGNVIVVGESTFDQVNQRYFRARSNSVEMLDIFGTQLALVARPGNMNCIEYDEGMNRLVGIYFSSTKLIITSVDIATDQVQDLDSIQLTSSVYSGESTFDQKNQRYFFRTGNEIYAYNLQTQTFETFSDPGFGFEKIFGIEFKEPPPPIVDVTAINSNTPGEGLMVYPNPAEKDICFQGLKKGSRIKVFNVSGHCTYDEVSENDKVYFPTKNQTSGIYMYEVTFDGNVKRGKLIIK
jgi:hypothetical protein